MLFRRLKRFIKAAQPGTIAAILQVPISTVQDWENGISSPNKDQIIKINRINSLNGRLKRFIAERITPVLLKVFVSVSKHTLFPYFKDRALVTNYISSFKSSERFIDAYSKGVEGARGGVINSGDIFYRAHQAFWATSIALNNEGDWVELGTGRGFTMSSALKYHKEKWNDSSKKLFLVDIFSSFEVDQETGKPKLDSEKNDAYCDDLNLLKKHFQEFNNVYFIEGFIPECLSQMKCEKISFLHIDLNAPEPEIAGLQILWERVVKGGILLLDDYGYPNRRDQHDAMNKFALEHSFEILQLPTGQGIAIK